MSEFYDHECCPYCGETRANCICFEDDPDAHFEALPFDDWHYCAHGCGRGHFDQDEPHRCACGQVCR